MFNGKSDEYKNIMQLTAYSVVGSAVPVLVLRNLIEMIMIKTQGTFKNIINSWPRAKNLEYPKDPKFFWRLKF